MGTLLASFPEMTYTPLQKMSNRFCVLHAPFTVGKKDSRVRILDKGIQAVFQDQWGIPVSCCAVNCTNRFKAGSGLGFYIFP